MVLVVMLIVHRSVVDANRLPLTSLARMCVGEGR